MNDVARCRKIKKVMAKTKKHNELLSVCDTTLILKFLDSKNDPSLRFEIERDFNEAFNVNFKTDVSDKEARDLVSTIKADFDNQRFNNLITACKKDVISAVITPFGLGSVVAAYDKNGGNVTTTHNAKEGVFANKEDENNFSSYDKKYDRRKWDNPKARGKHYEKINRRLDAGEAVPDDYTNGNLKKGHYDQDHVTPLEKLNEKASLHLYFDEEERIKIANAKSNLSATDSNLNRHGKRAKTNLETIRDKKNEKYNISKKKMVLKQIKSEATINIKTSLEISKRAAKTGALEASKIGMQQALGIVLYEFFQASFDEISDIYKKGFKNGLKDASVFRILKIRLKRIGRRISEKWKDVIEVFSAGFLSGFLSNIVTIVINAFIRTGERIVRIIREGFFSLLRAIKMLCFPPEGMTFSEAAHEASKLIASGLVITGGIILEQHVDNMIKAVPVIEPFADIVTTILIGGLTGIATTFIVYAIDKIDLFKVNENKRHKFIMDSMTNNLEALFIQGDALIQEGQLIWNQ